MSGRYIADGDAVLHDHGTIINPGGSGGPQYTWVEPGTGIIKTSSSTTDTPPPPGFAVAFWTDQTYLLDNDGVAFIEMYAKWTGLGLGDYVPSPFGGVDNRSTFSVGVGLNNGPKTSYTYHMDSTANPPDLSDTYGYLDGPEAEGSGLGLFVGHAGGSGEIRIQCEPGPSGAGNTTFTENGVSTTYFWAHSDSIMTDYNFPFFSFSAEGPMTHGTVTEIGWRKVCE